MTVASKNTLRTIAAVVWLSGGVVLLLKGITLFVQAVKLNPGQSWTWLAVATGLLIGAVKAKFLFGGFCRKNLNRIAALDNPQLWQAYRPVFYLFLMAMILLGATLSKMAIGNYPALLALIVLDFSIAAALLGSFREFFRNSQPGAPQQSN
ncbi:MAG: hypothetical protein HKN70_01655 [Gammaproteobacteria bacterium]|nr:hypothetical protein [Gammaproteobacteria bacterium]